jgi:hypothetical protein
MLKDIHHILCTFTKHDAFSLFVRLTSSNICSQAKCSESLVLFQVVNYPYQQILNMDINVMCKISYTF